MCINCLTIWPVFFWLFLSFWPWFMHLAALQSFFQREWHLHLKSDFSPAPLQSIPNSVVRVTSKKWKVRPQVLLDQPKWFHDSMVLGFFILETIFLPVIEKCLFKTMTIIQLCPFGWGPATLFSVDHNDQYEAVICIVMVLFLLVGWKDLCSWCFFLANSFYSECRSLALLFPKQ